MHKYNNSTIKKKKIYIYFYIYYIYSMLHFNVKNATHKPFSQQYQKNVHSANSLPTETLV